MTIRPDPARLAVIGMLAAALLLVAAGGAMVYRLNVSGPRANTGPRSTEPAEPTEPSFVLRQPPRVAEVAPLETRPATVTAVTPPAAPAKSQVDAASKAQVFADARLERRDSIWARQKESEVRDALEALPDTKVTLQSVQCASIRCTIEGTYVRGGKIEHLISAATKVGLTRARFRRVPADDGSTTFSAVLARDGYDIDGTPKAAAKTL